jgi:hypothetical protein
MRLARLAALEAAAAPPADDSAAVPLLVETAPAGSEN